MLCILGPPSVLATTEFKKKCCEQHLSEIMNVSEESFALLVLENAFLRWKSIAQSQITSDSVPPLPPLTQFPSSNEETSRVGCQNEVAGTGGGGYADDQASVDASQGCRDYEDSQSTSVSEDSTRLHEPDTDNTISINRVCQAYRYQANRVRKDDKPGAGPWTPEGMRRLNKITNAVIEKRRVRRDFEGKLKDYFCNQQNKTSYSNKRPRKAKQDSGNLLGGTGPRKVVVIDLFSGAD